MSCLRTAIVGPILSANTKTKHLRTNHRVVLNMNIIVNSDSFGNFKTETINEEIFSKKIK